MQFARVFWTFAKCCWGVSRVFPGFCILFYLGGSQVVAIQFLGCFHPGMQLYIMRVVIQSLGCF